VSRLTDLLKQARTLDAQLGADLEAEFRALRRQRTFGLVFERHHPEAVELPGRSVRRGDKVRILPARGETTRADDRLWRVVRITGRGADRQASVMKSLFRRKGIDREARCIYAGPPCDVNDYANVQPPTDRRDCPREFE